MAYRKKGIYEVFSETVCLEMRDDMIFHKEDFPTIGVYDRRKERAQMEFDNILQSEIAETILKVLMELYDQLIIEEVVFLEDVIYDDLSELYYRSEYRYEGRDYQPNFNIGSVQNKRLAILQEFVPFLVRYGLVFDLMMKNLEKKLYDI